MDANNEYPLLPARLTYFPSKDAPKGIRVRIPHSDLNQSALINDLWFSHYDSVQNALIDALTLRNKIGIEQWGNNWNPTKRYDQNKSSLKGIRGTKSKRNHSGVVGVTLVTKGKYQAWVATWVENSVHHSQQFNFGGSRVKSLTSEQAFEKAVILRRKMETKWYKV